METLELKDQAVLHKPELETFERDGVHVFLDGARPNWLGTDSRGARILGRVDGRERFGDLVRRYARAYAADHGRSWRDAHAFVRDAMRAGMLSTTPFETARYEGRGAALRPERLSEFWLHLTQTCNLACTHCLVSSGPGGERGESLELYRRVLDEARELGARRFYFTGGEPFSRPDAFELIRHVTETLGSELIVLTNATLFEGERLRRLEALDRTRLKLQVSLDGVRPEVNDAIRGAGVFEKASRGLKAASALGFDASLTAVVTRANLADLEGLPKLAAGLGAKSVHLMWLHKRGRVVETGGEGAFPTTAELLALARKVRASCAEHGVRLDNWESIKLRANGRPGVKYDLGLQCWASLCLYMDGRLYPSAATAGDPRLSLGRADARGIKGAWLDSPIARMFREASVARKEGFEREPFRFLTGGGDVEHAYYFSSNGKPGSVLADDPYHDLYVELLKDAMAELCLEKRARLNLKSGFNPPLVLHAMGQGAVACPDDAASWLAAEGEAPVRLLHSNCVLSFDVEKPYRAVRAFYGKAAEQPQKELCCPVRPDEADIAHIPKDVIERFYGCGSPIGDAAVRPGETTLDLGSGAGIDCFIAARKVGAGGKVIGVDMTDAMLEVAERCRREVAGRLGYDVVEFRKGFLESVPAGDKSVDLVTSNCVVNLSPDKPKVFSEIWRVLKDHGRVVVADIVSDRPVPLSLQAHPDLWGECLSGALSEEEFLAGLERAGFYGLQTLKKAFWKEVEGYRFYSVTVRGFKFEKTDGCVFAGQRAVYLGPWRGVIDEEGHLFPRGEAVEVCTDTAAKLKGAPYAGQFRVVEPDGAVSTAAAEQACAPGQGCC